MCCYKPMAMGISVAPGVSLMFSTRLAAGFHRWTKGFEVEFIVRKSFLYTVDAQTRRIKSSSQPINLCWCLALQLEVRWPHG